MHKKNNFVNENRLGYDNIRKGHQKQADLDVWMNSYNKQRTYSGKYCFGKTPM